MTNFPKVSSSRVLGIAANGDIAGAGILAIVNPDDVASPHVSPREMELVCRRVVLCLLFPSC